MIQARFAVVHGSAHLMEEKDIGVMIRTCVILHNMIVEDKWANYEHAFDYDIVESTVLELIINNEHHPCYETYF